MSEVHRYTRPDSEGMFLIVKKGTPKIGLNAITPDGEVYLRGNEVSDGNIYQLEHHADIEKSPKALFKKYGIKPDGTLRIEMHECDFTTPFKTLGPLEMAEIIKKENAQEIVIR